MPTDAAVILGVLLIVTAALLFVVGRRAAHGTLPLNYWVGIRTTTTMSSQEAWDAAHLASGRWLQIAGIVPAIVGIMVLFRPPNGVGLTVITLALIWMLAWVIAAGVVGQRAARNTQ